MNQVEKSDSKIGGVYVDSRRMIPGGAWKLITYQEQTQPTGKPSIL